MFGLYKQHCCSATWAGPAPLLSRQLHLASPPVLPFRWHANMSGVLTVTSCGDSSGTGDSMVSLLSSSAPMSADYTCVGCAVLGRLAVEAVPGRGVRVRQALGAPWLPVASAPFRPPSRYSSPVCDSAPVCPTLLQRRRRERAMRWRSVPAHRRRGGWLLLLYRSRWLGHPD